MRPTDDEIQDMLESRAGRASSHGLLDVVRTEAVSAGRSAARRDGFRWWPWLVAGVAIVGAVLIGTATIPTLLRTNPSATTQPGISASVQPSARATSGPTGVPPDAVAVRVVTGAELADLLETFGAEVGGSTFAVNGKLRLESGDECRGTCRVVIGDAASTTYVVPVGDVGPGPWDGSGAIDGTFALRITGDKEEGRSALALVGTISPAPGGLDWSVNDVLDGSADGARDDLLAVRGWLVATPVHPCPSSVSTSPPQARDLVYRCGQEDYLTPERYQPVGPDGVTGPTRSIILPSNSYADWAPLPTSVVGLGYEPREGVFLLRWSVFGCNDLNGTLVSDCFVDPADGGWFVRGRLDATPTSVVADGRYPGGIPRLIDGEPVLVGLEALAAWQEATDDSPFLVGGWFDSPMMNVCSGGIGPIDPNPLGSRGCPRYQVDGLPGRAFYPDAFEMPTGDGPIVLSVHTRDPGAATCLPEYIQGCWRRTVVDGVRWFGDVTTVAQPIGPRVARGLGTGVFVMEWRPQPDGSQMAVNEDVFTVPTVCPSPWPILLFSAHGDPRYGLVAVFPDAAAREAFQGSMTPDAGDACLGRPIVRPAPPRWVGQDNVLVLAYSDDEFANSLQGILADPQRQQRASDMVDPTLDRSLETIADYLVARQTGLEHAWGERLLEPFVDESNAEEYSPAPWERDVFRRHVANALDGMIEALEDEPTAARVGPKAWRVLQEAGVTRSEIFRVTYPGSTDPSLAVEEYLVIQMPESTFRDWQLIRIAGEPYPTRR